MFSSRVLLMMIAKEFLEGGWRKHYTIWNFFSITTHTHILRSNLIIEKIEIFHSHFTIYIKHNHRIKLSLLIDLIWKKFKFKIFFSLSFDDQEIWLLINQKEKKTNWQTLKIFGWTKHQQWWQTREKKTDVIKRRIDRKSDGPHTHKHTYSTYDFKYRDRKKGKSQYTHTIEI